MNQVASLPMYWRAENAAEWQAFWQTVQTSTERLGRSLPELTPPDDLPPSWAEHWLDPDLALSMTCSLPFRTALRGKVTYVGTLHTDLNCAPGHYYSILIRRKDDTANGPLRLAYNAEDSQSGWAVTQLASPQHSIAEYIETGSHAASAHAVAEGRADIAYLDAVTWRLLERFDPVTSELRVAGQSPATPSLPLITALGTDPAPLRQAILDATRAFAPTDPSLLGGTLSFKILTDAEYLSLPLPRSVAEQTARLAPE